MVVVSVVVGIAWGREWRGAVQRYHFSRQSFCSEPGIIFPGAFLIVLKTLFRPRDASIMVCIPANVSITHSVVQGSGMVPL